MSFKPKVILFVVNVDWYFISHRLIIAREAVKAGYHVYVAAKDTGRRAEIENVGASFINVNFSRSGTNPLRELLTLVKLIRVYRSLKPSVVHHIAMKPVVYGTMVTKWLKIPVINAVNGLGFVFHEGESGFVSIVITKMMKYGFKYNKLHCIFQNSEDMRDLKELNIVSPDTPSVLIKGAGVDLNKFNHFPLDSSKQKLRVILAARLLWSKGIKEFKEASEILFKKYADKVEFRLVGMADEDHLEGISPDQLKKWEVGDYFQWIPYTTNMVKVFQESDIVVLPSYYREGVPKSLLEACAVGRPIVTTNSIGCKECVDEGVNGFKVSPKSSEEVAQKIEELIEDQKLRIDMGIASRAKAQREFDVSNVVKIHLDLYDKVINE